MAAKPLMGSSATGLVEWMTPQGQALDEVKRQPANAVDEHLLLSFDSCLRMFFAG